VVRGVFELGARNPTLAEVETLGRPDMRIALAEAAVHRIVAAERVVAAYARDDAAPVYGLTTGVGSLKRVRVSVDDTARFNAAMIRDHAGGVGPYLAPAVTRTLIALRVHALGAGRAGVSLAPVQALVSMYNAGVTPRVRSWGSVGMSDLTVLAGLARALLGEGEVDVGGRRQPAAHALADAGIDLPPLGGKDALGLINANSYGLTLSAMALALTVRFERTAIQVLALTMEALGANLSVLDPEVARASGRVEQARLADRLRALLGDGPLGRPGAARELQDPISVRSAVHVHANLEAVAEWAGRIVRTGLGAGTENPLVDVAGGRLLSHGNFDTTPLVTALDAARGAVHRCLHLAVRRTGLILAHARTGLPTNLATREGDYGLGVLHHVAASLEARATLLAQATPLQADAVAEGIEDYGTNAPLAAERLYRLLELWRLAIAVEAYVASAAVRLRGSEPARAAQAVQARVEAAAARYDAHGEAVEAVAGALFGRWPTWFVPAQTPNA
jgi:histidine ammonia-lyase